MFDGCQWGLTVTTDHGTDLWRKTHYGFTRHSGHFFGRNTSGSFAATIRIRAQYESLYDQAGIMVRLDEANWIKAGIELSDGQALLSSVLTIGQSDWATGHGKATPLICGCGSRWRQVSCAFRLPQTVYDGHWSAYAPPPWQIGMRLDRYAARPSALG